MNKIIIKIISCFWILLFSEIKAEENAAFATRLLLEGKLSEATELLRKLADAGDKFAHARLLSIEGKYSEAIKIFEELADDGNVAAIYELSSKYDYGHGTREDKPKALRLLRQAANAGYPDAMRTLGARMYEKYRQTKISEYEMQLINGIQKWQLKVIILGPSI